ncbi:MAG TPA: hypothetical protein VKP64_13240 [Mycobacteriales bacterium]|nr:hypothetical protein [Mycobacteriales bacterium]
MEPVSLVDAVRTPTGRYAGALSAVRPDDLLATALSALVERTGVRTEDRGCRTWLAKRALAILACEARPTAEVT